jgi:hypothetical protein
MKANESKRYLGLELAGAKNQKTAVAALEYYPKGKKIFLLDIFERMPSGDQALLDLIEELQPESRSEARMSGVARMGVNVPLELPPCLTCTKKTCILQQKCVAGAVDWMHKITHAAQAGGARVNEFTPYTQRPVELWIRYEILPLLPVSHRFEVDEALGGNKAPLTARMHFLKRHLKKIPLSEVWPKLSIAILAKQLGISKRTISRYRQLEEGMHAREEILETLAENRQIFIYERDVRKLSSSLAAFDAFVCAYTAVLADQDLCAEMPKGFPVSSGWVDFPSLEFDESSDYAEIKTGLP